MIINGWENFEEAAYIHTDPSDPWFHFFWPYAGEVPFQSWWPHDDRNNPDLVGGGGDPAGTGGGGTTGGGGDPGGTVQPANSLPVRTETGLIWYAVTVLQVVNSIVAGYEIIRPDGSPYQVMQFQGGWLLDGCPINVKLNMGWVDGQQDALRAAGLTQCLPPITGGTGGGGTGGTIYRLLLETADGVQSGATYPTCSEQSQAACRPIWFSSLSDGVRYAYQHAEVPVQVFSSDEAWAIAAGGPVNQANILAPPTSGGILGFEITPTMLAFGAAAILLMSSGRK